jgi:copper chaperone CopZ|tara:strand:+ start:155 stop:490 length:336 start_codon:yes stop_codon:yes gene_type:complete
MRKILSSVLLVCFISIANILYAAETMVGQVNGMMCIKCQKMVTMKLIEVSPTAHVKVSWPEGVAISAFEGESNLTEQEFKDAILGTGFEVIKVAKADKFIDDAGEARKLVD